MPAGSHRWAVACGSAKPLREGLREEIERRGKTEATQVAAILANKLQTPAADANPEEISTGEVREFVQAFKGAARHPSRSQ